MQFYSIIFYYFTKGFARQNSETSGYRTGAGFYTRNASGSTNQNKVKPALQQQGSYLRR